MDDPVLAFESATAWEEWLAREHGAQNGVWVKMAKKATGIPTDAAYDAPRAATVPGDLQQVLDANPPAAAFFATLNSRNRFAVLYRVQDAKRPETRARRIETLVALLAEGKKLYP
jgi:uncharacterized protein YdeI (YjbR/CyaY-like superfamily)